MFNWLFGKRPAADDEPQVRVYAYPLVGLLWDREEAKGAPLTEAEVLEIRDRAHFLMMPESQARKFWAAMDAKIPMPRLDPDNIWEEWQALSRGPSAQSYAEALEQAAPARVARIGRVIDYAHRVDGVMYHGTLSDLDGRPKATWTYEADSEEVTREQPLTSEAFERLWNLLARAEVFRRSLVEDLSCSIDVEGCHVVGAVLAKPDGKRQCRIWQAPADENDAELVEWLEMLGRPGS